MIRFHPEKRVHLREVRGIILDWAGTTVDFGCMAPAQVFAEVFRSIGIEVTTAEARGPMGQAKVDHIRSMLAYPRIQEQWVERFGRASTELDVNDLYETFLPLQQQILAKHSDVIPGIPEAIAWCRARGWGIGSTTGYTRALMDVVEPLADAAGYRPDFTVCSDEVVAGRPAPWQLYHAAEQMQIYPMSQLLVLDDSIAGIQAGQHAGCITVAVAATGNSMGLSLRDFEALSEVERTSRCEEIAKQFLESGTDIVLDSAADLPELFASI
ncbi:MAG: phosphonoacetaldehyde hydrolase [Pirellula sp.]|jgi:phosphonoacetaldehyde hydrolase|nr:phosphonoacetaldehyde hydrolase [Pirellula sp.]